MGNSRLNGLFVSLSGRGIFIKICIILALCLLAGCTLAQQVIKSALSGPGWVIFFLTIATAIGTCIAFRVGTLEIEDTRSTSAVLLSATLSQTPVMGAISSWLLIDQALAGTFTATSVIISVLGGPFSVFIVSLPVILTEAAVIAWMADI